MESINIRVDNGKVNVIVDGALFREVHSVSVDYIKGAPLLFACVSDVGDKENHCTKYSLH